jgi:hypothetical protein
MRDVPLRELLICSVPIYQQSSLTLHQLPISSRRNDLPLVKPLVFYSLFLLKQILPHFQSVLGLLSRLD